MPFEILLRKQQQEAVRTPNRKLQTVNRNREMKILMIDNYDSFTYNLVHIIEKFIEGSVYVFRNDKITIEEIEGYDKIILSPGPGIPSEAGVMPAIIKKYSPSKSILGVCL